MSDDADDSTLDPAFTFELGEVLWYEEDQVPVHVTARLVNVDREERVYRVWDPSHTVTAWVFEQDAAEMFTRFEEPIVVDPGLKPENVVDEASLHDART